MKIIISVFLLIITGFIFSVFYACLPDRPCPRYSGPILDTSEQSGVEWIDSLQIGWFDHLGTEIEVDEIAEAGFDIVLPYSGTNPVERAIEYTDAASAQGLSVILEIPRSIIAADDMNALRLYVSPFEENAAVYGWYLADEPSIQSSLKPENLSHAYNEIKNITPDKPAYITLIQSNLAHLYTDSLEIIMHDFYPVKAGTEEFKSKELQCFRDHVAEYAHLAQRNKKEFWFIIQAYGEDAEGNPQFGRRLPTQGESQYMFYISLFSRPKGILYWTWYRTNKVWVRNTLSPMIRNFKALFPGNIGYETPSGFILNNLDADIMILHSEDNRRYLLVVSSQLKSQAGKIEGHSDMIFTTTGTSEIDIVLGPYGVRLIEITE